MAAAIADLRRLVEVPLDKEGTDLQPFLDVAALIRSEDLAGSGLSSARLDQIELYLAAHFAILAVENGGLFRSKQGQSEDTFRVPNDKLTSYNSTRFGQMAISLDTSGALEEAATTTVKKALFGVIGRSGNSTVYPSFTEES